MNMTTRLPAAFVLLATPLIAYADTVPSTGHTLSFVGGFAGGFLGALLACWLCNRRRGQKDGTDTKKY
jgi:hypothetical protein